MVDLTSGVKHHGIPGTGNWSACHRGSLPGVRGTCPAPGDTAGSSQVSFSCTGRTPPGVPDSRLPGSRLHGPADGREGIPVPIGTSWFGGTPTPRILPRDHQVGWPESGGARCSPVTGIPGQGWKWFHEKIRPVWVQGSGEVMKQEYTNSLHLPLPLVQPWCLETPCTGPSFLRRPGQQNNFLLETRNGIHAGKHSTARPGSF
jgi:hypothetical protein